MNTIYTSCLKELVRQISIECTDRGNLIMRVWEAYMNMVEKAAIETTKSHEKMSKPAELEITRVHKLYES